jgi:hypothetical protein
MFTKEELITLIENLPDTGKVDCYQREDGTFGAWVGYPPIPLDYPDGSHYEIPDEDGSEGFETLEDALVSLLFCACSDFGVLPNGQPGDVWAGTRRLGEGELVTCKQCGGPAMKYENSLDVPVYLDAGLSHTGEARTEIIQLSGGFETICPKCGEVDHCEMDEMHMLVAQVEEHPGTELASQ